MLITLKSLFSSLQVANLHVVIDDDRSIRLATQKSCELVAN